MRAIKTMVMLLGLTSWAISVSSQAAAVPLPFSDGFEGSANGNWVFGTPTGVITNDARVGDGLYSGDKATLPIASGNEKLWFSCYTKMKPFNVTDPANKPDISTNVAVFFMDTTGQIHASSNTTYVVVKQGLNTNAWHGFSAQLDYDNDTWNLYYRDAAASTNDPYELLNTNSPLAFKNGAGGVQATAVEIAGETYLDEVLAEVNVQPVVAGQPPPDFVDEVPLILPGDASGLSLEHLGTTVDLLSPAGEILGQLFAAGDTLTFWNGTTLVTVEWNGSEWEGNFTLTPTTGFFIGRTNSATATSGTVAYSSTYSHTNVGATAISTGWNLLVIPHTATAKTLRQSRIPGGAGDMIFLRSTTGWTIAWHTGSNWTPDITLPAGRTFWLQRRGAGASWPSHQL